jgi:hypothetical protein
MKIQVTDSNQKDGFMPFTVSITLTTREEYLNFHDNVMPLLKPEISNSPAYGAIFRAGRGEFDDFIHTLD